ncbi:hypothetical protein QTP86_015143 [Hemibagrus guttatus]|nr:hypothetical protein QTP86_015143 [Hemibagrus guttatus]
MPQNTGETLSEFLRRIEKILSKVIERDGLSPGLVDKVPGPVPKSSKFPVPLKSRSARSTKDFFCYRWGEEGHIATKCRALPNPDQVIQKLIGSLRRAKSEKSDTDDKGNPQNQACFSKKSQVDLTESWSLPKGLVGPASTVMVKLKGQECQALLDTGSQSKGSPYASPIVVARKKTGAIRMCIDYRTLNARTTPDQYTTPRIDDALDCLVGSKWFSVLDLRSGYSK